MLCACECACARFQCVTLSPGQDSVPPSMRWRDVEESGCEICGGAADPSHPSAVTASMQGRRPSVPARHRGSAMAQSGGSVVLSQSVTAAAAPARLSLCLQLA